LVKYSAWRIEFFPDKIESVFMYVSKYVILMIDAKCLVVYWQPQGHNATTMHAKHATRFHEKARACSSVMNWLRCFHFGEDIVEPGIHSGKPSDSLLNFKILTDLAVFLFHSARTLVGTLKIPRSMIWDHLQKGPFVVVGLRWVPHTLNDVTKRARVTMAESLSKNLREARHKGWRC
jgi:hypothetical protein